MRIFTVRCSCCSNVLDTVVALSPGEIVMCPECTLAKARHTPPPGCDTGIMFNQNLPAWLGIGHRVDSNLPPGTIEIWQDGRLLGRIENIGRR